jgi:aminoglycoside phosphotransferase (APT) family kinase protein
MSKEPFDSLTAPQRETAQAALSAAFGTAPIGATAPISGGASGALTYRIEISDRHYLLRIEGTPSPLRNPQQYISMRIAAEAGIAPRIHYADEIARIAIMDFIAEQPLETFPGGAGALAQTLGKMLAQVQATEPFPRFVKYPDIVARLWAHVGRTGLFAPGVLDAHSEHLAKIRQTYVWDSAQSVSSHNDPVPRNILFDGKRLWLIDWESAYRNDPLVDVSILLDSFATTPELESRLLRAWLGRAPDEALRARLAPVRALTRLYYAGVFLSASAAAIWRTTPDSDISAPTLAAFRQAIREGTLTPGTPQTKHILGKMFLASFYSGVTPPGFAAAV